jgi:SAM-dependent methyltransferase
MTDVQTAAAPPPDLHRMIHERVRRQLSVPDQPPERQLQQALRLLGRWRAEALRPVLARELGLKVRGGPFAGMEFLPNISEGCWIPKLLGCYEAELHPQWRRLRDERRYTTILDIGCAEGYYAVGLARMFPEAKIVARDTDERAKQLLAELAKRNNVAERIEIGGAFAPADFQKYAGQPTLVVCDIEGAEKDLLDPRLAPALYDMDIVVEMHAGVDRAIPQLMQERFAATHEVSTIKEAPRAVGLPPAFDKLDALDRLLAVWEFRSAPTPWGVMRARAFPPWRDENEETEAGRSAIMGEGRMVHSR